MKLLKVSRWVSITIVGVVSFMTGFMVTLSLLFGKMIFDREIKWRKRGLTRLT